MKLILEADRKPVKGADGFPILCKVLIKLLSSIKCFLEEDFVETVALEILDLRKRFD